jgi:hypothetical protein
MADRTDTSQLNWPRWAQALLIAVLAVLIVNRMTLVVETAVYRAGLAEERAWVGVTTDPRSQDKPGFVRVTGVAPGGPAARAGVTAGDYLTFERRYEYYRRAYVGERIDFTLDRQGVQSARHVIAEPIPLTEALRQQNTKGLLSALAVFVSMLIGCSILWRGWGNKTAMLLGAAMVTLGNVGISLPPWAGEAWLAMPMMALIAVAIAGVHLLLPFAMLLYEQHAGSLPRWHWQVAYGWLAMVACVTVAFASDFIALTGYLNWIGGGVRAFGTIATVSFVASFAYLFAVWRRSAGAPRNRLALIVLAMVAYALGNMVTWGTNALTGNFIAAGWLGYVNALMLGLIAPGLLAYAVLRHKLFDLGFAVNRTLVYASVGVLVLASFALIEWGIKQAIPKAWYGGSAYFSAAIAVGLYLLFNRIHHSVERVIERLFFHKWQLNEAALRRFVAAAAHVEKPEALAGHFERELARFSGGASAAVYARTGDGDYASAAGARIDADDPTLSAMRAEQGTVVPAELGSPIAAALALPMMHQAALAGFVLLGPKPTGEDYRPDEIAVLGWATQQVGLDLQAIRVRELEQSVVTLEARNRNLSDVLAIAARAEA